MSNIDGQKVRDWEAAMVSNSFAFAVDCCDREASLLATKSAMSGEDIRTSVLAAVEHRHALSIARSSASTGCPTIAGVTSPAWQTSRRRFSRACASAGVFARDGRVTDHSSHVESLAGSFHPRATNRRRRQSGFLPQWRLGSAC